MTYDKGAGYLFGTGYNGITIMAPDPKQVGTNRMDVVTNGRKLSQELMDGVKANGSILLFYEYVKPGEEKPIRKMGYAVDVPGLDMYIGTGAYLDDLDAKMKPIAWLLGLAILGIGLIAGSIAWMIGRSICQAARPARRPHAGAGRRQARRRNSRPRPRRRGRRDGGDRPDLQGQRNADPRARTGRGRDPGARRRGAPLCDGKHRQRFRTQRQRHRPLGIDGRRRHADHSAIDDGNRQRRQRACGYRWCGVGEFLEQCRHGRSRSRRTLELGCRDLPPGGAFQRDREQGGRRCRAHQFHRAGALDRRREDRRGGQADPLDRRPNQSAGAQRHHRGGACR